MHTNNKLLLFVLLKHSVVYSSVKR